MTDSEILLVVWAILAAHVVAVMAVIARRRHGVAPLLAVNLLVAGIVLIGVGSRGRYLFSPPDWQAFAVAAAECGVAVLSLATARKAARTWQGGLAIGVFVLHLLATTVALIFMLTFSVTRLI